MAPNTNKDVIIAVIGLGGTGKSHFIDTLAGEPGKRSSDGIDPFTQKIEAVRISHPRGKGNIVLVDTPCFDNKLSEKELLNKIKRWLSKTYPGNAVKLSGILYFHRISDIRCTTSSPFCHYNLFKELCGETAIERVGLVTTMWDSDEYDIATYTQREEELKTEYWKEMCDSGSSVYRFQNTLSSARLVLEPFINDEEWENTTIGSGSERSVKLKKKASESGCAGCFSCFC